MSEVVGQTPFTHEVLNNTLIDPLRHYVLLALALLMMFGAMVVVHYAPSDNSNATLARDLQGQIRELRQELKQVKEDQGLPVAMLNQYRSSVGYIYGVYRVGFPDKSPEIRTAIAGTGFLVGPGFVVTNRHVAEPWYGDPDAKSLIDRGAAATLERLVIFFPGSPEAVQLLRPVVSESSDLAVVRIEPSNLVRRLPALPLANTPGPVGQFITLIGYPLGIPGMLAKSPANFVEPLASRLGDIETAAKLARSSLIRPSTTYGHLGDIVGDKIIYDAATAHGGSGGPVLNAKGEVIGVNSAYVEGFSGSTQGVSVESLLSLLKAAQRVR